MSASSGPNNNNNSASVPRLSATPSLGAAVRTEQDRNTGISYINKFLVEESPFGDDGITSFDQLTSEHVAEDNMARFIHKFYYWLAITPIFTRQNTWLSTDNKIMYRKYAKQAIKQKFPTHPIFHHPAWLEWHENMESGFKKECERSRQLDDNINQTRKSESLYRDVSDRNACPAIRAKFLGLKHYDCKTVATELLKKVQNKDSASKLAEFNLSRAANARGSEHYGLRWDEGTFDPYFSAPDFDWIIFKQLERQCMFFFCDLTLYMLCPFFGLAVYFLYGGLRRDDSGMGPSRNFVFPHLHNMKRDSVAARLTTSIRSAIDDGTRKKAYTSRSIRKGQMGELRMHRDISLEEQYAHSGHTHGSMNPNAEGYIEANPAISAPGAMASAGYINCHMRPSPYSFHVLGMEVYDVIMKLVDELFKNDMPRLQPGGNLRPVIMICAARLIGSYQDLVKDLTTNHEVVQLILHAARRANVDDERVPGNGLHRYHEVLMSWSEKIKGQFQKENDQVSRDDPKVNEELLRKLIDRVEKLESAAAARDEQDRQHQLSLEQVHILQQEMVEKDTRIKQLEKRNRTLQRMCEAAQQGSPQSPIRHELLSRLSSEDVTEDVNEDDSRKRPPVMNLEGDLEGIDSSSKKKTKSASSASVTARLDGIQNSSQETKVGGITVEAELGRMWDADIVSKLSANLKGEEVLSKEVLFKRDYTGTHAHPKFIASSDLAKYDAGMSFVAMAISDEDWKKLCAGKDAGELDDQGSRELFHRIQRDTMSLACEIETRLLESGKAKAKSKATIHSLGTRHNAIIADKKKNDRSFDMKEYVLRKVTGKQQKQGNLLSHFGNNK